MTDSSVFHRILHARHGRKEGVDGDEPDRLIGAFVFLAGRKSATYAHLELGVEFVLSIQGANQLLRVQHIKTLNGLNVPGSDFAFFVYGE